MIVTTRQESVMSVRSRLFGLITVWLALVLALGGAGAFATPPGQPPPPILLGATLPLATFLALYFGSSAFRSLVLSADVRLFAAVQAWRLGGFWFLALY